MDYIYIPDDSVDIYPWVGGSEVFDNKEDAIQYALKGLGEHYSGFESTMRIKLKKHRQFHAQLTYCEVVVKQEESGKWIVRDW